MIELRWVMRPITENSIGVGGDIFATREKVLQYREWVAGMGGTESPVWIDIPVEEEK